jgi:GAF domain-containing protein
MEAALLRRLLRAAGTVDGRDELRSIAAEAAQLGAGVELREDLAAAAQLAERLASHQRREAELLALSDSARDLTSLRDLDRVLQAIVRRARQLLGSEVGYLSLFDEERQDFFVRATEGSVSEDFARIRVPLGVGICGAVARDKRPLFSSDYVNDRRFSHAKSIDTGVLAENITSILGVPLLVNETSIGVLFVGDRIQHSYTPQQIALLDSLGAHAAVGHRERPAVRAVAAGAGARA